MKRVFFLLMLVIIPQVVSAISYINVPLADVYLLRPDNPKVALLHGQMFSNPEIAQLLKDNNANLNTQALYAQKIEIIEQHTHWLKISIPAQSGVTGFVPADAIITLTNAYQPNVMVTALWADIVDQQDKKICALPMGTQLCAVQKMQTTTQVQLLDGTFGYINNNHIQKIPNIMSVAQKQTVLLTAGKKLIGQPYWWGGMAALYTNYVAAQGVDCSGLMYILFKLVGITLPRNSRAQYSKAIPIQSGKDLIAGDCVWMANAHNPERIVHVLLFCGDDTMLESSIYTGVAFISGVQKFGASLAMLQSGAVCNDKVVYLGRFLV